MKISALVAMMIATQIRRVGIHGKPSKSSKFLESTVTVNGKMDFKLTKSQSQPQEPDSPALQEVDYREGDHANTFEEYKRAVSNDFICEGNDIAKKMNPLWGDVVMIYPEQHENTKIPSLRGESGALLLESRRPDLCDLSKYKGNPNISCVRIESGLPENFLAAIEKINLHGLELIKLVAPNEKTYKKIISQLDPVSDGIQEFMKKVIAYMAENFMNVYQSSTPEKQKMLVRAKHNYEQAIRESNEAYFSTEKKREKLMITKAVEEIKKLGSNSSATVIVGANHFSRVSIGIAKEVPKRPIVSCNLRI